MKLKKKIFGFLMTKKKAAPSPKLESETGKKDLRLDEVIKGIEKLDKRQKELVLSIEGMIEELSDSVEGLNESINDGFTKDEMKLVNTVISIMDIIEDYHDLSQSDNSKMLFASSAKKLAQSGIVRIYDEKTFPDAALNSIVTTEKEESVVSGCILKTLRSGYSYKGKIIRKSQVVVNK